MSRDTYEKITYNLKRHPSLINTIKMTNKIITLMVYFIYIILLLSLLVMHDNRFLKVLLVPSISFFLVSAARNIINAPRPYEKLDIVPIIHKNTKGKSFPSRHIFSIFVIAMALYYISIPMGITLMIIGVFLAVIRVIGGIHFPIDVAAGAIIGILSGLIGFYL